MPKLTIIYPPAIDYKFMYQRPHQLMKAFAELGINVIYMNPADHFPQPQAVMQPFSHLPHFRVLSPKANPRDYIEGDVVLWCAIGRDTWIPHFQPRLVVYDSVDLAAGEFASHRPLIPRMEAKADIIFASAQVIYEDHRSRRDNVFLLPNAGDYRHFFRALNRIGQRPADLPNATPLIGYYGAIYKWMDLEFVYSVADHYTVVLIGANKLYNLHIQHRNVKVLPMKDYADLPQYLSWMDCTLIPFKLTPMIEGCDPVKFYEYISAGKPVVASRMKELEKYKDVCTFADPQTAPAAIEEVLKGETQYKKLQRQAVAQKNTWYDRAKQALEVMEKFL